MNAAGKAGSTLVEVMFSCLILAIIAIAGAAYLAQGRSVVVIQKDRRTALEVANSRLEEVRGKSFDTLKNLTPGSVSSNIYINGLTAPLAMVSTFQSSGIVSNLIQVTVSVQYNARLDQAKDRIVLTTLVAP